MDILTFTRHIITGIMTGGGVLTIIIRIIIHLIIIHIMLTILYILHILHIILHTIQEAIIHTIQEEAGYIQADLIQVAPD